MKPLTKVELKRQIRRFLKDKDRGISQALFAELAGIHKEHLLDVFMTEEAPLTEYVQNRVSRAYQQWMAGRVKVMRRVDNTRYVDYRKEAKPPLRAAMGLKVTSDGIKLRVGMVNRHDYSEIDLDEALRG